MWSALIERHRNPNVQQYKSCGGKGFRVCKRWHKFANFIKDVGPRPDKSHQLIRIDPNGNWTPENAKWYSILDPDSPKRRWRNVRLLTAFGRTQSINAWRKELGLTVGRIQYRIDKMGMSPEEALAVAAEKPIKP